MRFTKYAFLVVVMIALSSCGKQADASNADSILSAETSFVAEESTTTTSPALPETAIAATTTTAEETTVETTTTKSYNRYSDRTYTMSVLVQGLIENPTYPVYSEPNYNSTILRYSGDRSRVGDLIIDGYGNFWFPLEDGSGYVTENTTMSSYLWACQIVRQEYWKDYNRYYYHYDMDGDGTEEWIFDIKDYYGARKLEIYTTESDNFFFTYCGELTLGTLYTDPDGVLYNKLENSGVAAIQKITLSGVALNVTEVSELPSTAAELRGYIYYDLLGPNYTDPGDAGSKTIDGSTGQAVNENPAYAGQNPEYVEVQTDPPQVEYEIPDFDSPNVWCPYCGYGFFTSGIGAEGLDCPLCGQNFMP